MGGPVDSPESGAELFGLSLHQLPHHDLPLELILAHLFRLRHSHRPVPEEDEEIVRTRNLLNMRVDELELSVRSSNCLRAANIQTIRDLVTKSESEMLKYRNFGRKSLNEISSILEEMDLSFGMDISRFLESEKK